MPPQSLIYVVTIAIQVLVVYAIKHHICWWDILKSVHKCRLSCNKGLFSFAGMFTCHPWLTCNDLSDVISGPTLGRGAVKMVILGSWQGYPVTINTLREEAYTVDFLHGLDMVKLFQPHPRVVQLVGFCPQNRIYFTEYHQQGSAEQLEDVINSQNFHLKLNSCGNKFDTIQKTGTSEPHILFSVTDDESQEMKTENDIICRNRLSSPFFVCSSVESPGMKLMGLNTLSKQCPVIRNHNHLCRPKTNNHDNLQLPVTDDKQTLHLNADKTNQCTDGKFQPLLLRFQLCLDYVSVLCLLHSGPAGTRIMCDSNDVHKTLSQYLLTDNLRLVVNDLDALPYVDSPARVTAKCGHREITGDFVAPEQLWPFDDQDFSDAHMPGYDEKTDIWKIPQVCDFLIGNVTGSAMLKLHLFNINAKCQDVDPQNRPSSEEVFKEYENVWRAFKKSV